MSTLQRRRMMMIDQGVAYDGIPLMITNVGDEPSVIILIPYGSFNARIYYKKDDDKFYKKWNYNAITLPPNSTLSLFGDSDVFSSSTSDYANFSITGSSVKLSGRLASISHNNGKGYTYYKLFQNCTSVVEVSSDFLEGVNIPTSGYSGNSILSYLFSNTGITQVPEGLFNFRQPVNGIYACVGVYAYMFMDCKSLVSVPQNIFAKETFICQLQYRGMFSGCSSLTKAPDIYATNAPYLCYESMFKDCVSLENPPQILFNGYSGTLAFSGMFQGCTSLKQSPIMKDVVKDGDDWGQHYDMFSGCSSLNRVEVSFTKWGILESDGRNNIHTSRWLTNVSPTGTFICPKELADLTDGYYDEEGNFVKGVGRGVNTVPVGWYIDFPVIDARDGDANAMALMAVISQLIHADGTPWVKDSLVMMKSEAEKVTGIGGAFKGNTEITNLNVLKYFINATGGISFSGCTSLSSVTIPENITTLPSELLRETLVKNLFIPKSVINLSKSSNAFSGANYLEWVDVDEKNTKYNSYNGILYESSTFTCFYCPPNLTGSISIKPGTKIINNYFLNNRTKITSIYIPDGVETIKDSALQVSTWGISTPQGTLRIPSSVISLGNYFARGNGFEKVEYYSGVKIPKCAFLACLLLKTFVIYYEEGVVDLTLTPYSDGNYLTYHPFRDVKLEIIYVPDSLLAAYQNSENWKLGIDLTSKMRPLSEYTG